MMFGNILGIFITHSPSLIFITQGNMRTLLLKTIINPFFELTHILNLFLLQHEKIQFVFNFDQIKDQIDLLQYAVDLKTISLMIHIHSCFLRYLQGKQSYFDVQLDMYISQSQYLQQNQSMGNQNCPNYFCPPDDKPEKELQPKGPQQNQQKQTQRGLPQQRSSQIYEPKEHKKSQQEEWRNLLDIQCSKSIQRKGKVCRQQHQIASYCNNELCQEHAAMCNERRCSCFFRHIRCSKVDLQQFKMHMFENQKEIIIKMLSYEKGITDRLAQSRKQFIQNTNFFQIQESSSYKGKDINKILKQLQQSKINLLSIEQQVKPFQQQLQRIMHQLEQARRRLINKFLTHKQGHPLYELPLPYNQVCKFEVPSKILFDDNEGKQQMSFLVRQLGCPSQLKLKFRASQHDFLASKFHDYCDGIKDTVTIVSTQTNRIIAAYTPLEWNKFSESYLPDYSLQSFILQLSSKQKFPLKQNEKQYAIFNSRYRGPTFGEGHDLYIEDQCQLSSGSYLKFFSSYGQGSTTFGQSKFKVLQYEVYAVIK